MIVVVHRLVWCVRPGSYVQSMPQFEFEQAMENFVSFEAEKNTESNYLDLVS